tara:strand:- start:294 stop:470 length:177 start_codon:yes stop_codon:yes gene_type:complete
MKKIRSISISENIDKWIIEDSRNWGLTISANITRILNEYKQNNEIIKNNGIRMPVKNK